MKTKKVMALLMSSAMLLGCVTACDQATPSTAAESTEATEQTTATTTGEEVVDDLPGYLERSVTEVTDEDDGKITIFSNNAEFMAIAE